MGPLLTNHYKPGVGDVTSWGEPKSLEHHVGADGKGFVVVVATHSHTDLDPGVESVSEEDSVDMHACWVSDKGARCGNVLPVAPVGVAAA